MVHDATCISCQITSQHISTPRVLFSNKTPKKFAAVRCSFSSCRNFWAESGFAVATRYAGGFQVSKKSTSSMATASTTGIGRMGISKYVKHISNMSTYEGSQHSTFNIQHMSNMKGVKGVVRLFDCCDGKPNHFGSCQSFEP